MSVDLRLRHDRLLREQAVEMFEKGFGYRLTAKRLGVPAEAVRHWQKTWRGSRVVFLRLCQLAVFEQSRESPRFGSSLPS